MEPVLNEAQTLLRDGAARLCAQLAGPARARRLRDEASETDPQAWKALAAAGWLGTVLPERAGGAGLGMFEVALVLEQAGRRLLCSPLLEATAALWMLVQAGREGAPVPGMLAGTELVVPALPSEAAGSGPPVPLARDAARGLRVSGTVRFVPYAASAQAFLVRAQGQDGEWLLCLVRKDAPGVRVLTARNVDGSTSSELRLDDAEVGTGEVVARGSRAPELVAGAREALALGAGAELVGVSGAALDRTLEHLRTRHQFGKPLGSFQALQHRAADRFVDLELDRSLLWRVVRAWDCGQHHPAMVSAVKARTTRSALETVRAALQLHGAIGCTDEHDIGLYYKRAVVLAARYGNELDHTGRFSALTLADA